MNIIFVDTWLEYNKEEKNLFNMLHLQLIPTWYFIVPCQIEGQTNTYNIVLLKFSSVLLYSIHNPLGNQLSKDVGIMSDFLFFFLSINACFFNYSQCCYILSWEYQPSWTMLTNFLFQIIFNSNPLWFLLMV